MRSCNVTATEAFDNVTYMAFFANQDTPYVRKPIRKGVRAVKSKENIHMNEDGQLYCNFKNIDILLAIEPL